MSDNTPTRWSSEFRKKMNDSEFADAYVKEHLLMLRWDEMIERATEVLSRMYSSNERKDTAEAMLRAALEVEHE